MIGTSIRYDIRDVKPSVDGGVMGCGWEILVGKWDISDSCGSCLRFARSTELPYTRVYWGGVGSSSGILGDQWSQWTIPERVGYF